MKISKYVTIVLVLTLAAAGWLSWKVQDDTQKYGLHPQTREELLDNWARYMTENIWETSKYPFQEVVNREKGYFAVTDDEGFCRIVDRSGTLIKSLDQYKISHVGTFWIYDYVPEKYIVGVDRSGAFDEFYLIDRETLELHYIGRNSIIMHPSENYYLEMDENDGGRYIFRVKSIEGEVLCESHLPLKMCTEEGYLIENGARLLELETGEEICRFTDGEQAADYCHGFYVMKGNGTEKALKHDRYLLDGLLQPAFDGRIFYAGPYFTENYVYGRVYSSGYLGCDPSCFTDAMDDSRCLLTCAVYTHDGKLVYEGERNSRIEVIRNHTAVVEHAHGERRYEYINLTELGGEMDG